MTQIGRIAQRLAVAGNGTCEVLACEGGGKGNVTRYDLFPGVVLWVLDMRCLTQGYLPGVESGKDATYIIHCGRGALRVALGRRKVFSLEEGDLLCATSESGRIAHSFPTGVMSGLVLGIDAVTLSSETRRALRNFDVDLDAIPIVASSDTVRSLATSPEAAHILAELYEALPNASRGSIRIKVIELLQLVCTGTANHVRREVRSTRRMSHMQLAYQAQQLMMHDISRPLTISALADACDTSPTVLKESFRETFGVPVYTWYRTYRMHQAADLLLSTELTIGKVAERVGYANPSKFTQAFTDCMGKTPRAWRKERRMRRGA